MNVRKALWIAALVCLPACPKMATAQAVPVNEQAAPPDAGIGGSSFASPGGPSSRMWVQAEALSFWTRGMSIPALVTTGPFNVVGANGRPGVLNMFGTEPVIDKSLEFGPSFGGRFTVGGWLMPDGPIGIEASYLYMGQKATGRSLSETGLAGTRALSLPFVDALNNNTENSVAIALPSANLAGTVTLHVTSQLQSGELTAGMDCGSFCGGRMVGLVGYRYLDLEERLEFATTTTSTDPTMPLLTRTSDRFNTSNTFNGGQAGLRSEWDFGKWSVMASGKLAVGYMRETTRIEGDLTTNNFSNFTTPQHFSGGYLALPSNTGVFSRGRIAVIPETQLAVSWQPLCWLRLSLGYQFLYITSVARPGEQIDRVINTSQAPAYGAVPPTTLVGTSRPTFPAAVSDYYLQGLTGGIEFRF